MDTDTAASSKIESLPGVFGVDVINDWKERLLAEPELQLDLSTVKKADALGVQFLHAVRLQEAQSGDVRLVGEVSQELSQTFESLGLRSQ